MQDSNEKQDSSAVKHSGQQKAQGGNNGRQPMTRSNKVWGYAAGVITGVTYGLNPMFAMPLLKSGISVDSVLFFRYFFAAAILCIFVVASGKSLKVTGKQLIWLIALGILYSFSSLGLFLSYKYIPSGISTTIVFLYPIIVALIMCLLKVYPNWQTWVAIAVTVVAMILLCRFDPSQGFKPQGVLLAIGSALAYSIFIVIVNRKECLHDISNDVLTFYALATGTVVFCIHSIISQATAGASDMAAEGAGFTMLRDIRLLNAHPGEWINLILLAIIPTIISTSTLAAATRIIGATKASVMGVFEPVTAILVGALMFGEKITVNVVIGILLVIFAITFMITSPDFHRLKTRFANLKAHN